MDFSRLEKKLGISFNDKALLKQSLVHRSYLNEHPEYEGGANERLEFLGDAILEFVVSFYLFTHFPHLPEGRLTAIRSALVSTQNLAKTAKKLQLGNFLFLARGEESGGRKNPGILGDTVESLIGAIFLDQGLERAKEFIQKTILTRLPEIIKTKSYQDPKSKLQEITQEQYKTLPLYKILKEEGPDHAKIFTVAVFVAGKQMGQGRGGSRQEAEKKAAQKALEKIQKLG